MDLAACCATGLQNPLDRDEAEQLARVLQAVADPGRLQLLSIIRSKGEACACDLNEPLGLSQPTVSHHLKVLREAGLVESERRGTWVYYRARPETLAHVAALLGPVPARG